MYAIRSYYESALVISGWAHGIEAIRPLGEALSDGFDVQLLTGAQLLAERRMPAAECIVTGSMGGLLAVITSYSIHYTKLYDAFWFKYILLPAILTNNLCFSFSTLPSMRMPDNPYGPATQEYARQVIGNIVQ